MASLRDSFRKKKKGRSKSRDDSGSESNKSTPRQMKIPTKLWKSKKSEKRRDSTANSSQNSAQSDAIKMESDNNSLTNNTDIEIDILGDSGIMPSGNETNPHGGNQNQTRFVDVLGSSVSQNLNSHTRFVDVLGNTTSNINKSSRDTNLGDKDIDNDVVTETLINLEKSVDEQNGNLSLHSEVTSPIKLTERQFEKSFLNINGDESLRGAGTPPGSSVGPAVYAYKKTNNSQFVPTAAIDTTRADENVPFLDSNMTNYSSFAIFDENTSTNEKGANVAKLDKAYYPGNLNRTRSKSAPSRESSRRWSTSFKVWFLIMLSLVSNVVLFSSKVLVFIESHSLAVLASAVDSFLDLVSQIIVYLALRGSQDADEQTWPVGRSRLEPVGIIVCASLMGMASLQIVYQSGLALVEGILNEADRRVPHIDGTTIYLLVTAIFIKAILYLLCVSLKSKSNSVMVLAEDHRNDVLSNSMALATAYMSQHNNRYWWADAVGAIVISLYICVIWSIVAKEQAEFLVGRSAHPEFLAEVRQMANEYHSKLYVDIVRAYHFGKRYLVELEVVLPEQMYVSEAHDIALGLQKEVESLRQVERAFVHVDYQVREENEHKNANLDLNTPPAQPDEELLDDEDDIQDLLVDKNVKVIGDVYHQHVPQG